MAEFEWKGGNGPPDFDDDLARSYVGRYILVGVTEFDHAGKALSLYQVHGVIATAGRNGLVIALKGTRDGQTWTMPPALESIGPAKAGEYRLRASGEVIVDPDLLAT